VHTLTDVISSVGVVLGFKAAYMPPDKEHPFGHRRVEYITTLAISFLLFITGIEFIKKSVYAIANPGDIRKSLIFFLAIFISIFIKEFMARAAVFIGKKIDSGTLQADGWHHRSDALSSILVLVTFIVNGADGYLGIVVSLFIMYSGYEVARDAVSCLIGKQPTKEFVDELKSFALSFEPVTGVHDIIVNNYGGYDVVSLHIELDINMSFDAAHEISERVEESIDEKFKIKSVVHIDPVDNNDEFLKDVSGFIAHKVEAYDFVDSFHDLRKIGQKRVNIVFDISVSRNPGKDEKSELIYDLKNSIRLKYPQIKSIVIKIEPLFSY